jgi:hypothetical protein
VGGRNSSSFLGYLGGYLVVAFVWATPATLILASILPGKHPPVPTAIGYVLALVALPPAIGVLGSWLHDRTESALAVKAGVVLALAAGGVIVGLAVALPGIPGKRCVDTRTMTVATSRDCPGSAAPAAPAVGGPFAWYYGGSGTHEDEPVKGGSFSAPSGDDPAGRGGAGSGDDGDDGGSNGGGGSGGGDDGGDDG